MTQFPQNIKMPIMTTITVSSKYQIVIPKEIRKHFKITPGSRLHVQKDADGIHLIKEPSIEEIRGLLKGIPVVDTGIRDESTRNFP